MRPILAPTALVALLLLAGCDTMGVGLPLEPEPGVQAWGEMLAAVNAVRAEGATCGGERLAPAEPLIWDSRLEAAAVEHSADMAENAYFDHRGTDGADTGERVRRAGYDWWAVGENIARHQRTVGEVIADWVASPGHCRQLMDPRFQELGAAEANGYWTQVFGVPR